ncbi:MAG: carboxymethylenebutenolidase, partial [Oscillospiraceae bacterium]|nr:carboxymethylenebutenolidase [Oscillospiraceae bacterium]
VYVIEGGNHAQFGSYGTQKGDGAALIPPEQQWDETAADILATLGRAA